MSPVTITIVRHTGQVRRRSVEIMAEIAELTTYPIKACAGTTVRYAEMTVAGLTHDRSFMVVRESGGYRSQRRDPWLAVVRPEVSVDGAHLTLRAPGMEPTTIGVTTTRPRSDVSLFGSPYSGVDQGDTAAEWFSEVLGAASRLVRVPPEHDRVTGGATPGTSAYADSCPVHLVSSESLRLLNETLASQDEAAVPMDRFRPNIVITGDGEPHREDRIRRVVLGGTELGYAKLAIRCAVTTIDQRSGTRAGPAVLRALARYRRAAQGGLAFGTKLAVLRPGALAVGDPVSVSAWGASDLFQGE